MIRTNNALIAGFILMVLVSCKQQEHKSYEIQDLSISKCYLIDQVAPVFKSINDSLLVEKYNLEDMAGMGLTDSLQLFPVYTYWHPNWDFNEGRTFSAYIGTMEKYYMEPFIRMARKFNIETPPYNDIIFTFYPNHNNGEYVNLVAHSRKEIHKIVNTSNIKFHLLPWDPFLGEGALEKFKGKYRPCLVVTQGLANFFKKESHMPTLVECTFRGQLMHASVPPGTVPDTVYFDHTVNHPE
jgi:hypothetical protein